MERWGVEFYTGHFYTRTAMRRGRVHPLTKHFLGFQKLPRRLGGGEKEKERGQKEGGRRKQREGWKDRKKEGGEKKERGRKEGKEEGGGEEGKKDGGEQEGWEKLQSSPKGF